MEVRDRTRMIAGGESIGIRRWMAWRGDYKQLGTVLGRIGLSENEF